ncbi:hypothetical protein HaLaN_07350, partial [Haematococcus lacustris]
MLSSVRCSCCSCRASGGWESRLASASLETQSPWRVRAVRLGKLSSRCWARPDLHCCTVVQLCQGMGQQGCDNSEREQLVAALPTQLDAQGWGVQQVGQGEGAADWVEQQGCQGV